MTVPGGKTSRFLTIPHRSNGNIQYYGVDITPDAAGLGSTAVEIRGNNANCRSSYPLAQRCYQILPATPQSATVRFWYLNSESGGQSVSQMRPYRWNSSAWEVTTAAPAPRGTVGVYEWVEAVGVNTTGEFALADSQPGFVATDFLYLPYVDR